MLVTLCSLCNPTQSALPLVALNTNKRHQKVTQWITSCQTSVSMRISLLLTKVSHGLRKAWEERWNGKSKSQSRLSTKFQTLELMRKLSMLKKAFNGLKVTLVTLGNQLKTPMDTGLYQKPLLLILIHTIQTVDSL